MPSSTKHPILSYTFNHRGALEELLTLWELSQRAEERQLIGMMTQTGAPARTQLRKLAAYLQVCRETEFDLYFAERLQAAEESGEWRVSATSRENMQYPGTVDFFFTIAKTPRGLVKQVRELFRSSHK